MQALKTLAVAFFVLCGVFANAEVAKQNKDGVTVIHLDQHGGYFAAQETLADLKPGKYEFVVENKSEKQVGFQVQNLSNKKNLDVFLLEPGETRTSKVEVGKEGVRFRCPLNPTPWYDVDVIN
ncbi:hypothetical protein [Sessilibacter corallicola]|uniref:hypothetical protein n=1 Tax=Sessilibacter corallicola TaxID=2904075 RepID=UPI001E315415|nr:hypothetical protein [Sessilibacter corallicola]MCE2029094.1 hypothetical protein [Sessilibacter corallicola]